MQNTIFMSYTDLDGENLAEIETQDPSQSMPENAHLSTFWVILFLIEQDVNFDKQVIQWGSAIMQLSEHQI